MILDDSNCDLEPEYRVSYRTAESPKRIQVAMAERLELSGQRRLANRARFNRRGPGTGSFNGAHRRRDKRNGI